MMMNLIKSNWYHTQHIIRTYLPTYRPPLSYYDLFQSRSHLLRSRRFNNQDEVEASAKEFFLSKDKNWYQHWIKELVESWFLTMQYLHWMLGCFCYNLKIKANYWNIAKLLTRLNKNPFLLCFVMSLKIIMKILMTAKNELTR